MRRRLRPRGLRLHEAGAKGRVSPLEVAVTWASLQSGSCLAFVNLTHDSGPAIWRSDNRHREFGPVVSKIISQGSNEGAFDDAIYARRRRIFQTGDLPCLG